MTREMCGEANSKGPEGLEQGRNTEECLECNIERKEYKHSGPSIVGTVLPLTWVQDKSSKAEEESWSDVCIKQMSLAAL